MIINPEQLLDEVIKRNASDLHLVHRYPPSLRMNKQLVQLTLYSPLSPEEILNFFNVFTTKEQQELFNLNKEIDFGITYKGYRFRANAYTERDIIAMSLRLIPKNIFNLDELQLPKTLGELAYLKQGFVLVTGQTSQGKSTTLASIINEINKNRPVHIITVEDPIEFIYDQGQAIVSQREVKKDTLSFHKALKSVLREDPDVIVIGEMRDYETISIALTLAETGHLVFSTLHTNSSTQTVDRIIDVFPEEQQPQVRTQLANVLKTIVCQKLLPTTNGESLIPALEILFNNSAISSLIREGKTFQIDNVLHTSAEEKMIIFEQYLKDLLSRGLITKDTALRYAIRPKLMEELIK